MKDRWERGEPVNLSDFLKITPVANEIIRLSEELNMASSDLMWIVAEIVKDYEKDRKENQPSALVDHTTVGEDDNEALDEEWDDEDEVEAEKRDTYYHLSLKLSSHGKFPEVSFNAGMNEKEDLRGFLNVVMEILDRMDV